MEFYAKRTAEEQANRLPTQYQEEYIATRIDVLEIDGEEIHGYFEYSYIEEKSYTSQPVRSDDGAIHHIDEYETFLTPRIVIRYNMMAIEDYRTLMKKIRSKKNGFMVTFYDIVDNVRKTQEMYFAPMQMPKIYQRYLTVMGIQDLTIELIGTNRNLEEE